MLGWSHAYLKVVFPLCNMVQSKQPSASIKSGAGLRYGPEFLRLIESPELRAHFDLGAGPIATKRLEPPGASNTILADMVSTG
jgi:hypothetical protein